MGEVFGEAVKLIAKYYGTIEKCIGAAALFEWMRRPPSWIFCVNAFAASALKVLRTEWEQSLDSGNSTKDEWPRA